MTNLTIIMSHFIDKCKECKKIVRQCRCVPLSGEKPIRWVTCDKCDNKFRPEHAIPSPIKNDRKWYHIFKGKL